MYSEEYNRTYGGFFSTGFGSVIKGLLWAIILTVAVFTISSLIITYTPVSEALIAPLAILCAIVSTAVSGMMASKTAKSKGYLKGAFTGLLYMLILYFVSSIIGEGFAFSAHTGLLLAIGVVAGAVGGVLGINFSEKRRR